MTKTAAALAFLALSGVAAEAQDSGWTPLGYADTRHPSATEQARLDAAWGSLAGKAKFARYLYGTLDLPDGRKAFVSLVQTVELCEPAANADTDTDSSQTCPIAVTVSGGDGQPRTERGTACFNAALPEDGPQAVADNGTEVSVSGGDLLVRARVEGKYPKDCQTAIPLPR